MSVFCEYRFHFFVDRTRVSGSVHQSVNEGRQRGDAMELCQCYFPLHASPNAQQQAESHSITVLPPRLFNQQFGGVVVPKATVNNNLARVELDRLEERWRCGGSTRSINDAVRVFWIV